MKSECEKELEKVKALLSRAHDHLEYCGYGDSWEREISRDLQKDLNSYFNTESNR